MNTHQSPMPAQPALDDNRAAILTTPGPRFTYDITDDVGVVAREINCPLY